MVVLVGSTRPAKVEGTREALDAIARIDPRFANAILETQDLTHIAPRMPMSLDEILDGACIRASTLLSLQNPGTLEPWNSGTLVFAVGLEGGLHRLPAGNGDWSLQTWAAVTDGVAWGFGAGPSVVLPQAVSARVLAGEELGDVIDRLAGEPVRGTHGAWGVLTRNLISRRDAFRMAVIAAFAPFYAAAPLSGD